MSGEESVVFQSYSLFKGLSRRGRLEYMRFLHFNALAKAYYFMPLGNAGDPPLERFNCERWEHEDVLAALSSGALGEVPEVIRLQFMKDKDLKGRDAAKMEMNFRVEEMKELLSVLNSSSPAKLSEIFERPSLLKELAARMEKKGRRLKDWYEAMFARWMQYGGDDHALAPFPRGPRKGTTTEGTGKRKSGPKTFAKRKGKWVQVETPCLSDYWRRILRMAVDKFFVDIMRTPFTYVYKKMNEELCFQKTIVNEKEIIFKIAERKIPSYKQCVFHFKKMAVALGRSIDRPCTLPEIGERGGNATDIGLGQEVADADASYFKMFEIVYNDDDGPILIGPPTVLYLVSRSSGAVVSWYVSIGRENAEMYRFLIMYAFEDKNKKLDKLHFDGDRSGIVHGELDMVCGDNGPLKQRKLREDMATGGLTVVYVKPYRPKAKGDGEGGFSIVKLIFRRIIRQSRKMKSGIVTLERAFGDGRKRREDEPVRITLEAFERLLVEAISAVNRLSLRRSKVPREMVRASYRSYSPASIWRWRQDARDGDSARPRDERSNAVRFLEKKKGCIRFGKVRALSGEFSSDNLKAFDRKVRSANGWPSDRSIPIEYVVPPESGAIIWVRSEFDFEHLEPTKATRKRFGKEEPIQMIRFRNELDASMARPEEQSGETVDGVVGRRFEVETSDSVVGGRKARKRGRHATNTLAKKLQLEVAKGTLDEMAAKIGLTYAAPSKAVSTPLPSVEYDNAEPGAWLDDLENDSRPSKTIDGDEAPKA